MQTGDREGGDVASFRVASPPSAHGDRDFRSVLRRQAPTFLAVGWLVAAAFIYLLPALLRGTKLGSEDILGVWGFGAVPGTVPHNSVSSDQIEEMMPWAALAWEQVRAGHWPLWNPYNGYGMPLLTNFVSAPFSLPMLVSYLAPERFVYTIEVLGKLVIGGLGVLWLGRVLRLSRWAAVFGATTFELSGAFTAWLGWPMSGTFAWTGWVVGAVIMTVREGGRALYVAILAVGLAFAVYAGHPETLVLLVICAGIVAVSELASLARKSDEVRAVFRPVVALVGAAIAALGLSTPLLIPGLSVIGRSARTGVLGYPLPHQAGANLVAATYFGLPVHGSAYFGPINYYETAAYVGIAVLVLAAVGVLFFKQRAIVVGFVVAGVVFALLAYSSSVSRWLDHVPIAKNLQWTRSLTLLDFVLAVLGGLGVQVLLERGFTKRVRLTFAALAVLGAVVVGGLFVHHLNLSLPPALKRIQAHSFIWPGIQATTLLLAAACLLIVPSSRRLRLLCNSTWTMGVVCAALFAVESGFVLTATPSLWASSSSFFPSTPAVTSFQHIVGDERVGYADCPSILGFPNLGILPEANSAYHVREAAVYDGTVPRSYFTSYFATIGEPVPTDTGFGNFCPSISNASVARHFGISYILAAAGEAAPAGTQRVATIASEDLYKVPGSSIATLEPAGTAPDSPTASEVPDTSGAPGVIRLDIAPAVNSILYLHVTDFSGWTAQSDGKNLSLRKWGGTMLAVSLPPGHHVVVIRFVPSGFDAGLWIAGLTSLFLIATVVWGPVRRRRSHAADRIHEDPDGSVVRAGARR